jgi:hypothetical protein
MMAAAAALIRAAEQCAAFSMHIQGPIVINKTIVQSAAAKDK